MTESSKNKYPVRKFEENGMIYKSTELPFEDSFDFSSLEFPLPIKQSSERYAAQSTAKKTNMRMRQEKIEKSPTYPIMPDDLIWFAIAGYKEGYPDFTFYSTRQAFGPYKVIGKDNDLKIHLLDNTPKNRTLMDLVEIAQPEIDIEKITSVNIRLFRHVDRNNPLDITYAFEKESGDDSHSIIKPENFPKNPPLPEDHPNYSGKQESQSSSDYSEKDAALEPINNEDNFSKSGSGEYIFENGEDIDLHSHIHKELKDNSITHITRKTKKSQNLHNISNWRNWEEMREKDENKKGEQD